MGQIREAGPSFGPMVVVKIGSGQNREQVKPSLTPTPRIGLTCLDGTLSLVAGLVFLVFGSAIVASGAVEEATPVQGGTVVAMLSVVLLISGILSFFSGYGFFTLQGWG